MRHNAAAFAGALLTALVYATKPVTSSQGITLARSGDTALVIDTGTRTTGGWRLIPRPRSQGQPPRPSPGATDTSSGGLSLPPPTSQNDTDPGALVPSPSGISPPGAGGSSTPPVTPADLTSLRTQGPVVPVAGVAASKLVDSFDAMRGGTRRHNAIDIMAARNTPVVAVVKGKVLRLHNSTAGGLTVYTGDTGEKYVFLYGHLESYRPGLAEGASVNRGEIIGFVGSSGNASPIAPHLHFAVYRNDNMQQWWKGTPINPFLMYRAK
ncbi:MAG: peptidoglycan DD-metalloendopeptidase family protein [Gemmatimonadaceae bacterium]|nr:peptidoglycan DD-metalloendopeptidase family protein [Gemmatimonadaceae bacterium]